MVSVTEQLSRSRMAGKIWRAGSKGSRYTARVASSPAAPLSRVRDICLARAHAATLTGTLNRSQSFKANAREMLALAKSSHSEARDHMLK